MSDRPGPLPPRRKILPGDREKPLAKALLFENAEPDIEHDEYISLVEHEAITEEILAELGRYESGEHLIREAKIQLLLNKAEAMVREARASAFEEAAKNFPECKNITRGYVVRELNNMAKAARKDDVPKGGGEA